LNEHTDSQTVAKQYLLGLLADDEVARLEELYFSDDALFEAIEIAEDELIDAYVRGRLSDEDRGLFEKSLATSKRLSDRVHFGMLLKDRASPRLAAISTSRSQTTWWYAFFETLFNQGPALKVAAAACVLVIVLGGSGLVIQSIRLRNESHRVAAARSELEQKQKEFEREITVLKSNSNQLLAEVQQEKTAKEQVQQELRNVKEQAAQTRQQLEGPGIASIILLSGLSRSPTDIAVLSVSPRQAIVRLELILDFDEYSTYSVSIQSADGRELVSRKGRRAHGPVSQRTVSVEFPSHVLPEGSYAAKLSGLTSSKSYEPVAGYRFRLLKK
jgi:hypothetical protein